MLKTKSTLVLILIALVLLSACGGQKYISYEETYKKLEEAEYTVIGETDKDEILETLQDLAESYNKYVDYEKSEYNIEYPKMDANTVNVKSIIKAKKGDNVAFIFYCEDEDSAIIVSYALNASYIKNMGQYFGGQDKNFVYLYSAEVNDILKFNRD